MPKVAKYDTIASKIDAGVSYRIAHVTQGRRDKLQLENADLVMQLQDLGRTPTETATEDDLQRRLVKTLQLNSQFDLAAARALTVGIDGIEYDDGSAVTVDSLYLDGPIEFYAELCDLIRGKLGISEQTEKNSGPLSTSEAADSGRTSGTIAISAESKVST